MIPEKLIDAASNKVLAEDLIFMSGSWSCFFVNDTLLVGKHEASFSSASNSFGLINSSGEWIYPLSSETTIDDNEFFDLMSNHWDIINLGNGYVQLDNGIYSMKTNSVAENTGITNWILLEEDQGYGFDKQGTLYKYDFNTGELTELAKDPAFRVDYENKAIYLYDSFDHGVVYNIETKKSTELTNLLGIPTVLANGVLINTEMTGADGKSYLGAYDLNSEMIFEPIMSNLNSLYDYDRIIRVGNKVIIDLDPNDSAIYILDTTNGTLTTVENDVFSYATFTAGDDDTVIINRLAAGESTCVLADMDDITKTYSPFDS